MDDHQEIQNPQQILDILQRDIASHQESLRMISLLCSDKKVQRLIHAVICAQDNSIDKIIDHNTQNSKKEDREPGA